MTNIDSIRSFGKEKRVISLFKKLTTTTKDKMMNFWNYWRITSVGQILILGFGMFFILYFPIRQFLNGNLTLGTLSFIYTTYIALTGYLYNLVHGIRGIIMSVADLQDLFEYGKVRREIKDKPNAKKINIQRGKIEFKKIKFSYGKKKLFEDFDLEILPNQKVALVGHSGCGKTSLIKLLYRFYDLEGGEILIDGENISDIKQESLRGEMSIVPQECVLFDDTIYNNIKFSNPSASKNEVMKAIRFSQLDKIIEEMPKKERTIVGERGVRLSGGEKQRVSIARAILANKKSWS